MCELTIFSVDEDFQSLTLYGIAAIVERCALRVQPIYGVNLADRYSWFTDLDESIRDQPFAVFENDPFLEARKYAHDVFINGKWK